MNRQQNFDRLKDKNTVWDLAVIGGGSSGLGVALDAVSRGLSVALFEKSDFAKGTSSRSTKLVHGGVRYLAQGNIGLVREALRERGRLLQNAPHLTRTQSFIIPIYSWWDRFQYTLGLKIYDWLSGSLSLGKSTFISKKETLLRLPPLKKEGLLGGVVYQDGQFDDARLAIHLAQTITDLGGCVLNYTKVTALIKSPEGKICGLNIQEEQSKEIVEIKAKMVVNATGVFADKVLQMDQPEARKTIQPSQGIHLVLDAPFLNGKDALMIPKTKDGRVLFALPWHDKLIVGTTDTLREKAKLEPKALQQEINFILKTAKSYLSTPPRREDVRAIFAGLRPLARPKDGQSKTKEISRSHKILLSASGLLTLTGGKWTTFRKMGEDTVNFFSKVTGLPLTESKSATLKIHSYTTELPTGHWSSYGSDAEKIQALAAQHPEWQAIIHPNFPHILAEVVWACQEEMALTLEDVLSRRIRMLVLDAQAAVASAPLVASTMAKVLGKNELWIAEELQSFYKISKNYLITSYEKSDPSTS